MPTTYKIAHTDRVGPDAGGVWQVARAKSEAMDNALKYPRIVKCSRLVL